MSVWDLCTLDLEQVALLGELVVTQTAAPSSSSAAGSVSASTSGAPGEGGGGVGGEEGEGEEYYPSVSAEYDTGTQRRFSSSSRVDELQGAITAAEESCRNFMTELDAIVFTLGEVGVGFNDVTSRTNSLMVNCESLLDQQHSMEVTVEKLRDSLRPFDDVELIANQLGIPIDARSNSVNLGESTSPNFNSGNNHSSNNNANRSGSSAKVITDPRSSEFKKLLVRIQDSMAFLVDHKEYMDAEKYHHWLVQLRSRAFSLVARAMKSLLEGAARQALQESQGGGGRAGSSLGVSRNTGTVGFAAIAAKMLSDDVPIEGASIYRKFRGLGFRMKELQALLGAAFYGQSADENNGGASITTTTDAVEDVRQMYVTSRQNLLLPFVKELSIATAVKATKGKDKNDNSESATETANVTITDNEVEASLRTKMLLPGKQHEIYLCASIHHAYSMLLRVAQLEHQLFQTLFVDDDSNTPATTADDAQGSTPSKTGDNERDTAAKEVVTIVAALCNVICDGLRPLIIHESSVDELCRVAGTLAEDVRSQIATLQVPREILAQLEQGVSRTVSDTQERLVYCAEKRLRQEVTTFKPSAAHLSYPQILEECAKNDKATSHADANGLDAARAWYPPLRHTLALLSKLYGIIEPVIFEDFASRAVRSCVHTLLKASEGISKSSPGLHGELFLVRSLLTLREQLMPFDIRLQGMERKLDFSSTGSALTHFASNPRAAFRFDKTNSIWQLAKEGLPSLHEDNIDAKRELDEVLKAACGTLKESATRGLLSGLDTWLTKVSACIGDIPITHDHANTSMNNRLVNAQSEAPQLLVTEKISILKSQAFVKSKRVLEVLQESQTSSAAYIPDLKKLMKLYVVNSVARVILMKPVQQEVELMRRKVETVVASCIEPGQERRDIEQLIASLASSISSELIQQQ